MSWPSVHVSCCIVPCRRRLVWVAPMACTWGCVLSPDHSVGTKIGTHDTTSGQRNITACICMYTYYLVCTRHASSRHCIAQGRDVSGIIGGVKLFFFDRPCKTHRYNNSSRGSTQRTWPDLAVTVHTTSFALCPTSLDNHCPDPGSARSSKPEARAGDRQYT